MSGTRVKLNKGVHHALEDFQWMHNNIASRPTRIAELVPLDPVAEGHHDASWSGAGGIWFPSATLVPRSGYHALNRFFGVTSGLTTSSNDLSPRSTPMELSPTLRGLLHLEALTQAFDITERTVLSKGITSAPLSGSKR
eukprot:CCRYP_006318-RA/>CCRYP_006318-RA protein AED:0.32 eAED:0.39 QI:0/-1/0/1/-1/1/1/0/138